jgi:hypothetical protein
MREMNETERFIVGAGISLLLFLTTAFVVHTSPRFPGSLAGSMLGIAAATLMVLLLLYPLAKYSRWLKPRMTRFASMRALLTFHVYAGVAGALLGILHTGHKYQSTLGIALVITMLIVVVTGFVGRYYLPHVSAELREQQSHLATLRSAFDRMAAALPSRKAAGGELTASSATTLSGVPILRLVDGIADLEYAIASHETLKTVFLRWVVAHVVAAILMYFLLALHVAGEIYFGLRWLS